MDPLSLKTLLNTAFDKLAMLVDFDDVTRDYIIAKVLMKEGITLVCGQMLILMNSFDIEDEDSNHSEFSKSLITHSHDAEVMRYALSCKEGDHRDFGNLRESALMLLQNTLMRMCSRLPKIDKHHSVFNLFMDCVSLYTEHVPSSWPDTDNNCTMTTVVCDGGDPICASTDAPTISPTIAYEDQVPTTNNCCLAK
eukprot:scaffold40738_cov43-Cyclotella_meneghiniana.AAC.3